MADELQLRTDMTFEYGVARQMAPGIRRLIAPNPSAFTFHGTNTYLLGDEDEVTVIDPGPDVPSHLQAILNASHGRISNILLTHTNHDHMAGLDALKTLTGAKTHGFDASPAPRGRTQNSPSNSEFVDHNFSPDIKLRDGDHIKLSGSSLSVHHTPGHAPDHLCFLLHDQRVFFSGDHVMGWNTSVVAPPEGNMGDYIRSLEKLLEIQANVYFPGHGGQIQNPRRFVKAYLLHRKMRDASILKCIQSGVSTVVEIRESLYPRIDDAVLRAAELSVFAPVEYLIERELVRADGPVSLNASFLPA